MKGPGVYVPSKNRSIWLPAGFADIRPFAGPEDHVFERQTGFIQEMPGKISSSDQHPRCWNSFFVEKTP